MVPCTNNVPKLLIVAPELMLSVPLFTTDPVFTTVVPDKRSSVAGAPMVRVWLLVKLVSPPTVSNPMRMSVEPSGTTPRLHSPALLQTSRTLGGWVPCQLFTCALAGVQGCRNARQRNATEPNETFA